VQEGAMNKGNQSSNIRVESYARRRGVVWGGKKRKKNETMYREVRVQKRTMNEGNKKNKKSLQES